MEEKQGPLHVISYTPQAERIRVAEKTLQFIKADLLTLEDVRSQRAKFSCAQRNSQFALISFYKI